MSFIDIIIGVLLVIGLIRGVKNGFFVELASLVSFILGIYIAIKFSYLVKNIIQSYFSWSPKTLQVTSFILTIILVVIAVHLLARIFTKIADFAFLGWLNKIAGAVFATLKTVLLLGVVLGLFQKVNINSTIISKETQESSLFFNPILKTSDFILPVLKNWFEDLKQTALTDTKKQPI